MNERIETTNDDEASEALERFNRFHDGYVESIEIKFENYKGLNDEGASSGIGNADKTIILTVNPYPYGKEHNQLVQVEFIDVKSFEIINEYHSGGSAGPTWGISEAGLFSFRLFVHFIRKVAIRRSLLQRKVLD